MPKLKRNEIEQKEFELRIAIENKANEREIPLKSLAVTAGFCEKTMCERRKNPGRFTYEELLKISKRLGGLGITL